MAKPGVLAHHQANLESKAEEVRAAVQMVEDAKAQVTQAKAVQARAEEELQVKKDEHKMLSDFVEQNPPESE